VVVIVSHHAVRVEDSEALDRDRLRPLMFEDAPLGDLLLSAFTPCREALQRVQGVGVEIVGPRSSHATVRIVDFARSSRIPFTWRDPALDAEAGRCLRDWMRRACP
jgi:hypothetical protein